MKKPGRRAKRRVLTIDVGGTHVKFEVSGNAERREFESSPDLSAKTMAIKVLEQTKDWSFDAVSIGYPGVVTRNRIVAEPRNLGRGWRGFDFGAAFRCPVKVINDAAMQAVGSYQGGRMLFLGLGTGLGTALILDGVIEPMELAHLPYRKHKTYEEYLGVAGFKRLGKKRWRKHVRDVIKMFSAALQPDYVMIGGGNAQNLGRMPENVRLGDNDNAFAGGYRLWQSGSGIDYR